MRDMKRQETRLASSSSSSSCRRRENSPDKNHFQTKSIGCMSGIFKLVCRYHNRHRSLTFGKKQEKTVETCDEQSAKTHPPLIQEDEQNKKVVVNINGIKRLSCEVPRSPTLPAEIRRSNSAKSPAIVARLMGLEEENIPAESVAEHRRKLLGALEKCDEDLKAIKKIIELVNSTSTTSSGSVVDQQHKSGSSSASLEMENYNRASSLLLFDEFARSAFNGYSKRCIFGRVQHQKPGQKKKPGEEEQGVANICFFDRRIVAESVQAKSEKTASSSWTSSAMADSVKEVCRDIAWGEKREIGRIGLALQDYICRDLIEEIVKEMGCCCNIYYNTPLPFEACKRRLYF